MLRSDSQSNSGSVAIARDVARLLRLHLFLRNLPVVMTMVLLLHFHGRDPLMGVVGRQVVLQSVADFVLGPAPLP
jgi:hypothetical protein